MDIFNFEDHFIYGAIYVILLFIIYDELIIKLGPIKSIRKLFTKYQSKETSIIVRGGILLFIIAISSMIAIAIGNNKISFFVSNLIMVFLINTVLKSDNR